MSPRSILLVSAPLVTRYTFEIPVPGYPDIEQVHVIAARTAWGRSPITCWHITDTYGAHWTRSRRGFLSRPGRVAWASDTAALDEARRYAVPFAIRAAQVSAEAADRRNGKAAAK